MHKLKFQVWDDWQESPGCIGGRWVLVQESDKILAIKGDNSPIVKHRVR